MATTNSFNFFNKVNIPIVLKKQLDFSILEGTPKEIIKSLQEIHEKNKSFFEAMHKMDLIEIEKLIKEDYPKDLSPLIKEDLDKFKGNIDSFSEDWDDVINEIFYYGIKEVCSKPENENLLILLADYNIHQSGLWGLFRGVYFSAIKNEKQALKHTSLLYENCKYLNNEHHEWIKNLLCNKSTDLFDKIFETHKKHSEVSLNGYKVINSLVTTQSNFNTSSWIKYFDYYLDDFIKQEKINFLHIDKYLGPVNSVYYNLLDVILNKEELKLHVMKSYNEKLNYEYEFNIQIIMIIEQKLKQLVYVYALDDKSNYKRSLGELNTKRSIVKKLERNLFDGVQILMNEKSPSTCYEIFKTISLPEKYYQPIILMKSLENLNNSEDLTPNIKNRKL